MQHSTMARVEATVLFAGESADYQFADRFGVYSEDESGYILPVGPGMDFLMRDQGCSAKFREAYREAASRGAVNVVYWW